MFLLSTILCAAQMSFAPINHRSLPAPANSYQFVVVGDNRPAGAGLPPTQTYQKILNEITVLGPKFVLSTGDLYYGNEETIDQYKQEEKWMKPLLEALPCPFYNVPGNHEINNRQDFIKEYQATTGSLYGSFEYSGLRFTAVCTEMPAKQASVGSVQLDWLKKLENKPTVFFQHHPVFKRESNPDAIDDAQVQESEVLHGVYKNAGAVAVFEGHDHVYDYQVHDGIPYCITGGAGSPLDGELIKGGFFHYTLVTVKDQKIESIRPLPVGAIDVQTVGATTYAANYSDEDIVVNNLSFITGTRPEKLSAKYSTKSKTVDVPFRVIEKTKAKGFWRVVVSMTLPKHRAVKFN